MKRVVNAYLVNSEEIWRKRVVGNVVYTEVVLYSRYFIQSGSDEVEADTVMRVNIISTTPLVKNKRPSSGLFIAFHLIICVDVRVRDYVREKVQGREYITFFGGEMLGEKKRQEREFYHYIKG